MKMFLEVQSFDEIESKSEKEKKKIEKRKFIFIHFRSKENKKSLRKVLFFTSYFPIKVFVVYLGYFLNLQIHSKIFL